MFGKRGSPLYARVLIGGGHFFKEFESQPKIPGVDESCTISMSRMICHFDRENGKSPIGMEVAHEEEAVASK